ncbi:uncharacterized protein L969DRAFT_43102 [Mixia osmundae IAM 14324]|uniref:Synaptobrevin homolog YKT6 n=1 Tax=Mixia osmundae (strain CBS 9802 / IAM 14324 / JCM 22182 / KY 12970) TaxID=764103 RepID=G7DTE1_MIXOS|nr:uncharacterized protein L969DRAFT_43102 [Mixia osmundae IAM 14324]KEI42874.1 hypothetical protein L969DRAFT_43102 [Mixia osmundae IAM 14324]GAA93788.1 hypothetical protein E5Q_00434 [Mixia osmundae IAM 14324]
MRGPCKIVPASLWTEVRHPSNIAAKLAGLGVNRIRRGRSRDDVILAEHSTDQGRSSSAASLVLSKIPPNDSKLTYAADDVLFHYIKQNHVVCLVMAGETLGRKLPFAFLTELHKRFTAAYSREEIESAASHGMHNWSSSIEKLMQQYADGEANDPYKQAQADIADVKKIMVQNVEQILSRGERIELLVDKTDAMSTQARAFRKRSQALRRKMWWKNTKLMALTAFVVVLLIYLLAASQCGGALNHC